VQKQDDLTFKCSAVRTWAISCLLLCRRLAISSKHAKAVSIKCSQQSVDQPACPSISFNLTCHPKKTNRPIYYS